jgi:hypothetical protein
MALNIALTWTFGRATPLGIARVIWPLAVSLADRIGQPRPRRN